MTVDGSDFDSGRFYPIRVYTQPDVIGVEFGGSLKNVIALATKISDGIRLGSNARAALITRGLAEITRLACSFGAEETTLAGLAGRLPVSCGHGYSTSRTCEAALCFTSWMRTPCFYQTQRNH